ncbi:translation initiation factor eIF4e [Meredithblackwellia eburnea MCA 4105]
MHLSPPRLLSVLPPSPNAPGLSLTPSTPETPRSKMEAAAAAAVATDSAPEGWRSPQPIPMSFLPAQAEATLMLEKTAAERSTGRRKAPTLAELSTVLRLNRPDKFDPVPPLPVASSNDSPQLLSTSETAMANSIDKTSLRPRLAASVSNAGLSRSLASTNILTSGRRASLADVLAGTGPSPNAPSMQRRASALPSLEQLSARFKANEKEQQQQSAKSAGAEPGERERILLDIIKGAKPAVVATTSEVPSNEPGATSDEANAKSSNINTEREQDTPAAEEKQGAAGFPFPVVDTNFSTLEPVKTAANSTAKSPSPSPTDPFHHPLQHPWTFYFQNPRSAPSAAQDPSPSVDSAFEKSLSVIGNALTVESFCRLFNWIKRPSQLEIMDSVHIFKDGIKPTWKDERNRQGGKWNLTIQDPVLMDRTWTYLVLGLVGEELDEGDIVTGAVVAARPKGCRIQLWLRDTQIEHVNSLARRLLRLLELNPQTSGIQLDFTTHLTGEPKVATSSSTPEGTGHGTSPYVSIRNLGQAPPGIGQGARPSTGESAIQSGGSGWRDHRGSNVGIQGGVLGGMGSGALTRPSGGKGNPTAGPTVSALGTSRTENRMR